MIFLHHTVELVSHIDYIENQQYNIGLIITQPYAVIQITVLRCRLYLCSTKLASPAHRIER